MKILFITPHLSTGGGPQYLLRQIQELNIGNDIYCVEYSNITGGVLVVQRNQTENILGNRLITLPDDKSQLLNHINIINPDVIHFEEIPEYFCDKTVASKIYTKTRSYKIIETSHDSSFNPDNKEFFPDAFVFVSEYQKKLFSKLNIISEVIEYPIEYKQKSDRTKSLIGMGLDPNKIHVLNIGLFTHRKNQAEIIEYAKQLLDKNIHFHFVGNQADNFREYWEPLMKSLPKNCTWWGERKNVDAFYNAMDIFLFTSKGTSTDKETNPLVIKEAIGWNMPILMYNLPVYCGMYDKYKNIYWLTDDKNQNLKLILSKAESFTLNKQILTKFDDIFDVTFESDSNKLNLFYKKNTSEFYKISFKDIDSNAPMYFVDVSCNPGLILWVIPIPKHTYSFIDEPSFRGFKIEIYNNNEQLVASKELYIKDVLKIRDVYLDLANPFDCLFNNYNEMFVHRKYDCYGIMNKKIVVDIGANSGLFTQMCLLNGAEHVYSIEPNKKSLLNLKKLAENNSNITVIENAVSNKKQKLVFYSTDKNTTIGTLHKSRVTGDFIDLQETEVDCITLDDVIKNYSITNISLLKMDVEGAEYEIIESLTTSICDKIESMLVEYHENTDKKINRLVEKVLSFGYKIHSVRNQSSVNNDDITNSYENFENGTIYFIKQNYV